MHRTREITREFQEIPQAGTTSHRVKIRGFARYLIKNSEGSSPETLSIWILLLGLTICVSLLTRGIVFGMLTFQLMTSDAIISSFCLRSTLILAICSPRQ